MEMPVMDSPSEKSRLLTLRAWGVHFYTSLGLVLGYLALLAIFNDQVLQAVVYLAIAAFIDGTDGMLARRCNVHRWTPNFDGRKLDDIIDYLNYVLVPCFFLIRADLLPQNDALWLAALPLLASAYGFCQKEAKTADHFFLGFPSYWNIVAFYFFVMQTPRWINAFLLLAFSALVFVPIKYLYPSRSPVLRGLTVTLGSIWGAMVLGIIYQLPQPHALLVYGSLTFPAYYLLISFWRSARAITAKSSASPSYSAPADKSCADRRARRTIASGRAFLR